jgi:hypothetical protein
MSRTAWPTELESPGAASSSPDPVGAGSAEVLEPLGSVRDAHFYQAERTVAILAGQACVRPCQPVPRGKHPGRVIAAHPEPWPQRYQIRARSQARTGGLLR